MAIWGAQSASGRWGASLWGGYDPAAARAAADAPAQGAVVTNQSTVRETMLDAARSLLRTAAEGLRTAFSGFRVTLTPIVVRASASRSAVTGSVSGTAARVDTVPGRATVLETTVKVNTQSSTERSSSAALGLDLSAAAVSRLSSANLGLDVMSPETASTLSSALALGLDVSSAEAASTLRSSNLGLDLGGRASSVQSTAEMNASPTSLSSYEVAFTGSTSRAQLSGSYSGTSTSLEVRINVGGTIGAGQTLISFRVNDDGGNALGNYTGWVTADQVIDVGDTGLKLRFTAGTLGSGRRSSVTVDQTPTTVDASAAFNAAFASAPRFENFQQVTAGAFTVNGTSIAVNANDSINSVLARINGSGAGVTAAVSGDRVTLTSNADSESAIVLGGDTSGFLAATKLAGASTTVGNLRDDQQALAQTTQFGGVASGSFTVNGVAIAVDRNTDSLATIVDRINGAGADVTARYDEQEDRIVLETSGNSEDLITVSGDTTGFLAAAGLSSSNTVRGNVRDDRQALSKMAQFGGVSSGSFTVNGVAISLNSATDTIESLVSRINGAGAGVTASYDAAADKLRLTATTNGPGLIEVDSDTTGFLAAAHLDTDNTVRGHIAEDRLAFAELDPFSAVVDGSFVVDGQTIAVTTDDTVQSIITKINGSGARVTAAFDGAAGVLRLTTTFNSEDEIAIGSDTSGFLAAAGLSSVNTVRGNLPDDQQVLAKTSQFATVASGWFDVNGVTISVDADADSLQTVIGKINASAAGVTAHYDSAADRLRFTPNEAGATLVLDNDTSGFLAAARVATGAQGTRFNPDAAFNGTGAGDPLFDPGITVGAGSFTINGTTIAVSADDTLNNVLSRITASNAGVTASYDSASQTVTLRSKTAGAAPIVLGDDTSGLLAAVRLDGTAIYTPGAAAANPFDASLNRMTEYAAVTAGTITVNGQQIAIDPASTSIRGVVSALDALADVSATLNETTGSIVIAAERVGATLTVEDTSGLAAALGIDTGTQMGVAAKSGTIETISGYTRSTNTGDVAAKVSAAIDTLVAEASKLGERRTDTTAFRGELESVLDEMLDAVRHAGVRGLSVVDEDGRVRLEVDRAALEQSLEGLGDRGRAERAIEDVIAGFAGRIADVAARPQAQPDSTRIAADRALAQQVYLKPLIASRRGAVATEGTTTTDARRGVSAEVREQIRRQFAATAPDPQLVPIDRRPPPRRTLAEKADRKASNGVARETRDHRADALTPLLDSLLDPGTLAPLKNRNRFER